MVLRISNPGLLGLAVVRALGQVASTAMLPFIVLWAHEQVGLNGPAAGVLFLVQAVGEFVAGLLIGSLADRLGRRRVLIVSAAGMGVGYGLLAAVGSPVPAFLLFFVGGVFESAFHPVIGALVGDAVPEADLRRAFGTLRIGTALGRVLGPLLGAALIVLGLRLVFVAAGVLLLAAAVVAAAAVSSQPSGDSLDDEPEVPPGTVRALVHDPGLAVLVLAAGLLAIASSWFEADGLVIVRRQTPLAADAFAILFAVAAITVVVTQVPITRLTAAISPGAAILAGGAIQGAGLALLMIAPVGYPVLVVSVVLTAIGEALTIPAIGEIVTIRAGARRRTSYQAALSLSQDLGGALGPLSGLSLVGAAGPTVTWGVAAVASGVSAALSARAAASEARVARTG